MHPVSYGNEYYSWMVEHTTLLWNHSDTVLFIVLVNKLFGLILIIHWGQNNLHCTEYSYAMTDITSYNRSVWVGLHMVMIHDDYEFLPYKFHSVHSSYVVAKVSLQTCILWVPSQGSLSAHCTCDLSPALIWRTSNACTLSSDMVEQGSIYTCWTASHWIRVCIHTLVHWTVESMVLSHQVAIVLTSRHVVCPGIIMDVPRVEA